MALEAVGVPTLFLAELAIEFELLQAFGFHAIGQVLDGPLFSFWHLVFFGWSGRQDVVLYCIGRVESNRRLGDCIFGD